MRPLRGGLSRSGEEEKSSWGPGLPVRRTGDVRRGPGGVVCRFCVGITCIFRPRSYHDSGQNSSLDLPEVALKSRPWAARVAIFSGGILAVAAFFLVVVRALNVTVAGVEPEALVLTAMMTAPFTLGFFLLLVLGAAAAERVVRRGRA